jgi:hypothetical protein
VLGAGDALPRPADKDKDGDGEGDEAPGPKEKLAAAPNGAAPATDATDS